MVRNELFLLSFTHINTIKDIFNMEERHDIVIPLGVKSYENENFEIKVAIGSIRKYCKFTNRIIIVSQIKPIKELGDDIVWVVGHRVDARYAVTDTTKRVKIFKV